MNLVKPGHASASGLASAVTVGEMQGKIVFNNNGGRDDVVLFSVRISKDKRSGLVLWYHTTNFGGTFRSTTSKTHMSRNVCRRCNLCSYLVGVTILMAIAVLHNSLQMCEAFILPSQTRAISSPAAPPHQEPKQGKAYHLVVHQSKKPLQDDDDDRATTTRTTKSQRDGSIVGVATVVLGGLWLQLPLVGEDTNTVASSMARAMKENPLWLLLVASLAAGIERLILNQADKKKNASRNDT
eukprot:scaffold37292_cov221-Amphora_coffeaeformis.AAC.1